MCIRDSYHGQERIVVAAVTQVRLRAGLPDLENPVSVISRKILVMNHAIYPEIPYHRSVESIYSRSANLMNTCMIPR